MTGGILFNQCHVRIVLSAVYYVANVITSCDICIIHVITLSIFTVSFIILLWLSQLDFIHRNMKLLIQILSILKIFLSMFRMKYPNVYVRMFFNGVNLANFNNFTDI